MRWLVFLAVLALGNAARADYYESEVAARSFEVAPGHKVQTFAAEPYLQNPVAFSMDEKGQMWVAETHRLDNAVVDITKHPEWLRGDLALHTVSQRERFLTNVFGTNAAILTKNSEILRVMQAGPSGHVEDSQIAWNAFRSVGSGLAAGVLARDNKVFLACVPGLYRLDDFNGLKEVRRPIGLGYGVHIGVTGHDLHGLTLGMDGKIYFTMGDRGFAVRSGASTLNYPDTGAVLRCNQDGGELEVVAIGLRNPQDLTFDELGNLWTADNDTDGEDPPRLIHVVEGADYGWRNSYQHMKGYGPWIQEKVWEGRIDGTLPSAGNPAQGPAGFAYYPGVGLSEEMKGRFLLCDFPGGLQSFTVEPKGASYVIKDKKHFLWGCWPTHVDFAPDGFMYFSDWVGGWSLPNKGRIYRVSSTNATEMAKIDAVGKILQGGFDDKEPATLLGYLEHDDMRVRLNAHLALGKKKETNPQLRAIATDPKKSRVARLHAIWALRLQGAIEPATIERLVKDPDPEIRAQSVVSGSVTNIVKLLKDESPRVRLYAAQTLHRRTLYDPNNSTVSEAILDFIDKNADEDPFLTLAGVRVLIYSQPALLKARKHSSPAVRRAAMLAARAIGSMNVATYLDDPALMYEAARAINDVPIPAAYSKLAEKLATNCPPQLLSRAVNANFRMGGADAARRLAAFAVNTNAPMRARIDALECVANWQQPDEIDRVMGLWRPIGGEPSKRAETLVVNAMQSRWAALWKETDPGLTIAALNCVAELESPGQTTNAMAVFQDARRPVEVRAKALETLGGLNDTNFAPAMEVALKSDNLRIGAMALAQSNTTPAVIAKIVNMISQPNDVRTWQAAYGVIRRLSPPEGAEPLKQALAKLGRKELPLDLGLDALQAAEDYPDLKDAAAAAAKGAFADPANGPLLVGGDADVGKRIFKERMDVSCIRCHSVGGAGGTLGPPMDGIGGRQTREYLLESILDPNKTIAKGYESLLITLTDGSQVAGRVARETGVAIDLLSPDDGPVTVRKPDVRNLSRSLSAMPEGLGDMLTPFDLRNLVEYLASLK
jgi:quinoprotein glucose dehydrogenase